jgi:two-component system response regulator HydG
MIRKVLVVDPDSSSQQRCARLLRDCRCEATLVDSIQAAKRRIVEHKFDAALVDFQLASTQDFDLPAAAQRAGMRVIVAIDALQTPPDRSPLQLRGCSLLTRPLKIEELTRALDADELSAAPVAPVASPRKRDAEEFAGMVGGSEKMQRIFRLVSKVAVQRHPVLILGESGTGKELVARAIHDLGPLRDRPFVPIDCGALPPTLIESELFGHVKGAFTGAAHAREGLIASADSGTVFFDELGELPLELQSRLLRTIQEHEFRPIGSNQSFKFDARIIAAIKTSRRESIRVPSAGTSTSASTS